MKKLLLLAAAAVLGFPADAATGYKPGDAVTSSEGLTSGKYFIVAASKTREGFIKMRANDEHPFYKENVQDLSGGTADLSYVFDITVTTGEGENPATFTIKSLSDSRYLSYHGNQADGKGHVAAYLEANENAKIANLALDTQAYEPATGMNFSKYFAVYQTNVTHTYPNDSEASIPYFHVNGSGFGNEHLAWWKKGEFNFATDGSMTLLAFVKATEIDLISTTVNFKFEADGETYATATVAGVPDETVQVQCPDFCAANGSATASVKLTNDLDGKSCDVIIEPALPFAYTTTAAEPKKWQLVGQHTNQIATGHMWKYTEDDVVVPTENVAQSTATSINANFTDAHLFAFVGNLKDGFKIYNKAAGEEKTLYYTSDGGKIGNAGTNPDVWKLKVCSDATNTGLYCCFSADNFANYLNWQGNAVNKWNNNDAGSGCYFYTASTAGITFYEENAGTPKMGYADVTDCKDAYDAAKAAPYDLEKAQALNAALLAAPLVKPACAFYRIKNTKTNKYIVNSNNNANRIPVETFTTNPHTNVFYYDGTQLISYANGLVFGQFLSGDTANSWRLLAKDEAKASAGVTIKASSVDGQMNIIVSDGRYIYGGNAADDALVDCGGADGDGYRWTLEKVDWLPVYFGDAAEATIYSPVALTLNGRAKAHTLYANTDAPAELVKTPAEAIAANTPYFLEEHTTGNGWDANTKCVYLQVNYSGAAAAAENPNALSGSIYATQKAADKRYFTLGTENEEAHFLAHSADATYVPGFTAHYAVATDNVVAEGKYKVVSEENKTTGISEVVAGGENGAKVIYDLQGRRVANASKGIFIINGVKTLVK